MSQSRTQLFKVNNAIIFAGRRTGKIDNLMSIILHALDSRQKKQSNKSQTKIIQFRFNLQVYYINNYT